MTFYVKVIGTVLARQGLSCDPRVIEALMRVKYGTLDHLSLDTFAAEARSAHAVAQELSQEERDALVASYGLS